MNLQDASDDLLELTAGSGMVGRSSTSDTVPMRHREISLPIRLLPLRGAQPPQIQHIRHHTSARSMSLTGTTTTSSYNSQPPGRPSLLGSKGRTRSFDALKSFSVEVVTKKLLESAQRVARPIDIFDSNSVEYDPYSPQSPPPSARMPTFAGQQLEEMSRKRNRSLPDLPHESFLQPPVSPSYSARSFPHRSPTEDNLDNDGRPRIPIWQQRSTSWTMLQPVIPPSRTSSRRQSWNTDIVLDMQPQPHGVEEKDVRAGLGSENVTPTTRRGSDEEPSKKPRVSHTRDEEDNDDTPTASTSTPPPGLDHVSQPPIRISTDDLDDTDSFQSGKRPSTPLRQFFTMKTPTAEQQPQTSKFKRFFNGSNLRNRSKSLSKFLASNARSSGDSLPPPVPDVLVSRPDSPGVGADWSTSTSTTGSDDCDTPRKSDDRYRSQDLIVCCSDAIETNVELRIAMEQLRFLKTEYHPLVPPKPTKKSQKANDGVVLNGSMLVLSV